MKSTIFTGFFLPLLVAASPTEQTHAVSATAIIEIAGSVDFDVIGIDSAEIRYRGEDDSPPSIQGSSTHMKIRVPNAADDLTLYVPRDADVRIQARANDVHIRDLRRRLEWSSVSGDINVDGSLKSASLTTISGDVDIEEASTSLKVHTVSGDIDIQRVRGTLEVKSTAGDIDIDNGELSQVAVTTSSGDIDLRGRIEGSGGQLATRSGDIDLAVPAQGPLHITFASRNGDVDSEIGTLQMSKRGQGSIQLGQGGPTLELVTYSGDISIDER